MKPSLPRILSDVTRTLQVQLEIAKAIRTLAAPKEDQQVGRQTEPATTHTESELIAQIVRELLLDLRKAGFNPDEPRVPAGNPEGGQWTGEGGHGAIISDATPDNTWKLGGQHAANNPPGIGHNQGPPLEEPPRIPPKPPATQQALNNFIKAAAYWLAAAGKAAAARYLRLLQAAYWITTQALPYIRAYLSPPKTLIELQQDVLNPQIGYDIHHIVEQTPARKEGFSDDIIDGADNLVRIPTLKHWQINGWYGRKNDKYGGLSPRDYLRGKSWEERMRVGKEALMQFGVLKP
jgi:hypothetical protein